MDEFQSEKEQIEEIKQWWKKNGSFIVTGMILGVAVLGGWKYWQNYKEHQAAAASARYEELMQAIARKDRNGATDLLAGITSDFDSTPYAAQAALGIAKFYVESDEAELAAEQLRFVLDHSKDEQLKRVARLRLARVELSLGRADDALATLDAVSPGKFAPRYNEVRGDIYAALGRNDDARLEYLMALDQFEPGLFDRELVEMKLSDLAADSGAAASAAPADTPSDAVADNEPETEPDA